jgi:hypothetical protein
LLKAYAGQDLAGALAVNQLPVPLVAYAVVPFVVSVWGMIVLVQRFRRVI